MISKLLVQLKKHKFTTGIALLLVASIGYWSFGNLLSDEDVVSYAVAQVQKGMLIKSISGTGQVLASDQADIKPKVPGELTELYIAHDHEVKAGQLLAIIDTRAAQRAVNETEISLESAKIDLEELLSPPDALSLLQAQNAFAQAEHDLRIAKRNYESADEDVERTLAKAYEDGYSDVSTLFFKLPDYMEDLKDVLGTKEYEQKHITSYRIILGENPPLVQQFINDYYYHANNFYQTTLRYFEGVFRDNSHQEIYKLINDALKTTQAISRALESARHIYDAITTKGYHQYFTSASVDRMKQNLESDLFSIYPLIASLQNALDTIDDIVENTPDKILDAELALRSAEEKVTARKLALEELEAGEDSLTIRTQQNVVAQKEASLINAKSELADHYIYAPLDGVIAQISPNIRKGDNVSSGSVLAILITKQQIAEITLNEIDIVQIKAGQKVTLTFDAIPDLTLTGRVTEVSVLGSASQGIVTYAIKIGFDTQYELLKTAMTVTASIVTEAKPDALLVPNSAIKSQGGISYVEMVVGSDLSLVASADFSRITLKNSTRQQQVEIGLSNDEYTEIVRGLQEGDVIVTRTFQPSTGQTQQSSSLRFPGMGSGRRGGFSGTRLH